MPARFERVPENVMPCNISSAGGGGHKTREDSHGGTFTCSVGPEEAHDFPFVDLKAQTVDGHYAGIFLRELFNFDHLIYLPEA